jgi:hypothetical protein
MNIRRREMRKRKVFLLMLVSGIIVVLAGSCGKKGQEKVNVPEMGFSMNLPEGWKVDDRDHCFFYEKEDQYNNYGDVISMPAEGLPLSSFVDKNLQSEMKMEQIGEKLLSKFAGISNLPGTGIVSKTDREINGLNTVELIIHREGYHILTVWMSRGQDVVRVSFQVLDEKFPEQKAAIIAATESIKLN